ncbi:peptide chain release factor N(5)-glutamine methyltransferase [Parasphingopyxis algicola]|uniref:peptide chain release factor N(5)-glutamine methyltransferase n=1 Tax=Parasphingopyxis algicola TaxID=2026624 RepID=UPI0015A07DCA|nr:peptide chain release factor N(5)-glutamine methyltransferase [Parasphingopyxis algicola]QLC26925.1 peptide chain release factor N(5)-glutamine methyltransferase [Parasphingopyxis algicola]
MRDALRAAAETLSATSETPRLDAELLMAHALGESRESMLLRRLDGLAPSAFDALVERRSCHEPLAYITGIREFWSLDIEVSPGVLIPRPDSETLIETARRALAKRPPSTILDLGTGSGALLLAALSEWPDAMGVGVDRSDAALAVAERNAERLGFADRAQFRKGDWGDREDARCDLILCNPPYVDPAAKLMPDVADFEPGEALFAADTGLADYRRIVPQLPRLLAETGVACLELGVGQSSAVSRLCADQGLLSEVSRDLAGQERCMLIHS